MLTLKKMMPVAALMLCFGMNSSARAESCSVGNAASCETGVVSIGANVNPFVLVGIYNSTSLDSIIGNFQIKGVVTGAVYWSRQLGHNYYGMLPKTPFSRKLKAYASRANQVPGDLSIAIGAL